MTPPPSSWQLAGFEDLIDTWVQIENPSVDVRILVRDWIFSRYDDPLRGVNREPGFDNLWTGVVPGTFSGDTVVVCSYFVYSAPRIVAASGLATLSWPA